MLRWESLLSADGVDVTRVACDGRHRGWSPVEPLTGFGIVLVSSGLFRREVDGTESVLDVTTSYLQVPGREQRMAHPAGGDLCTSITVARPQAEALTRGERASGNQPVFTTPALDLAHRLLLRRPSSEAAYGLVGAVLETLLPRAVGAGFPVRGSRRRRVADDLREALHHDPGLGLGQLAAIAGLSPYHLTRVFKRATGQTLSRYKARLRTTRALERLAGGERDLARLAIETGFADQAHLTRTLRSVAGHTPAKLRTMLGDQT